MANPTTIPEELLTSILSLLSSHDLTSVARVCNTFRRTSEPLLYANVELRAASEALDLKATPAQYKPCHLLHRSLQARPELASLVKTMTMEARHPTIFIELCSASETSPAPTFPNLTTLTLNHAQTTGPTLHQLLSTTPNLQAFHLDSECDAERHDRFRSVYLDCDELASALELVKGSLERLEISVEFITTAALEPENGGSYEEGDAWGIKGSLGQALKGFHRLTGVDVPWAVLLGWSVEAGSGLVDCLPVGLRTLVLTHDLGYFYSYGWTDRVCSERMLEYLGDGGRRTGLELLGVRFDDEDDEGEKAALDRGSWKRVEEKSKEVGCEFLLEGREL